MMAAGDPRGTDRAWMEQALALGALGEGATSPNPRVGCVLVRDGRVVGRGYHRAPGTPHAEALAASEAGALAAGATAYVGLEPCSHHGRTPPCADLLVDRGVARVVAAARDPNPLVDGRGFERLRAAGIPVDVGLLAEESERLNEPFFHFHGTGRPLLTIKAAISLDGLLAARDGASRFISGEPARRFAHRLRLTHDAVLVGAGTVRRDDPRLTVRLPGVRGRALRVVVSRGLDLDPDAAIFAAEPGLAPPVLYASHAASTASERRFDGRAVVRRVPERDSGVDLDAVLADLGSRGVQSVLAEGGGRLHASLVRAGLAGRAVLFVSLGLLGARSGTPLLDLESVREPAAGWRLVEPRQLALGLDLALVGRLAQPPARPGEIGAPPPVRLS
jgi:diaminohydroxyphosphoribosylaminopyrimidine deaminase/5-amino-6-(5-phosphoribosylamino)uracil reductase